VKKITIIIFYSIYIFILLGFILHTSSSPQILNKYTYQYALFLTCLILLLPIGIWIINFIFKETKIKYKKKNYKITSIKKVLLASLGFILFLLIVESYLRTKYYGKDPVNFKYSIDNYHPFLQFQQTKDSGLNINSENFRGDEIERKKSDEEFRIFILGGSTVLNSSTPYNELFSKLLQDKLAKEFPDKKIVVINAGNDGFTSEHSVIQYLFKIKDFYPDLIVMWQGINDWYYSCKSPNSYGEYRNDYSNFYSATSNMVFARFLEKPIVSLNLISVNRMLDFSQKNFYSDILRFVESKNKYLGIYSNPDKYEFYNFSKFPSLNAYERNMSEMIKITDSDEVPLILANQATLYKKNMTKDERNVLFFGSYHCKENGKYPSIESMLKGINKFNNVTKNLATENQVPFVDLDSKIPKNLNYFTDDAHYTSLTNQLISKILFDEIVSGEYLK